jgi:hypothetical protein
MLNTIEEAINRPHTNSQQSKTMVIIQLPGRIGNSNSQNDHCTWSFNRYLANEAHKKNFAVLEREEIERRLLFKSEYYKEHRFIKQNLHLEAPAPQIVATSLLGLISCLYKNESLATHQNVFKHPLT